VGCMLSLQGTRTSATLMVANLTDPEGDLPGKGGSRGLYSLFWQLRGDMCAVRTDFKCVLVSLQLRKNAYSLTLPWKCLALDNHSHL